MKPGGVIATHYRVVRLVGRGGMGDVYEVVDARVARPLALKLMHAHIADQPALRERFELEARLGARVESPQLVEVIDAGVDRDTDRLYLVMELLEGENLAERLARLGPRPADEVVAHVVELAQALDRMHERGVVHRDLKPANLFRTADQRIKVLDLGIAKVLVTGDPSTTHVTGTAAYMAPEQLRGRGVGPATDRYALALVAYTLLVGHTYWEVEAALDPVAFGLRAVQGPPDRASRRAARHGIALPAAFDAWFARATARDPFRRFGSAIAQAKVLAAALGVPRDDLDAVTIDEVDDEVGEATTRPASPEPTLDTVDPAATTAPPRRRTRRWLAAGGLALAIVGALVAVGPRDHAPASPPPPLTLACPVLAVDQPRDGWLGAAAATVACERARVVLGGAAERAIPPAELLALPRHPVDGFPSDPYDGPEARTATLAAARARDASILDGSVRRASGDFVVELVLRDPRGELVATGRGRARALYAAVRAAMAPVVARMPSTTLDPALAGFSLASSTATALGTLDLAIAFANNAGVLVEECAGIERGAVPAPLASWFRYDCAYTLGLPAPEVVLPEPRTSGALAARVRIEHMRFQRESPAAVDRLVAAYRDEASAIGRSTLATSISRALQMTHADRALEWAHRAVQADPRNFLGERCAPWVQLATLAHDTDRAANVTAGWRGWAPWDSYAWSLGADRATSDEVALAYARRAYELSPLDTYVAGRLADRLLRRGLRDETRAISVMLGASELPVHALQRELLEVRLEASSARFAAALGHAEAGLRITTADHGWVRQQRLELAWRAVQIALLVGRGHELADRAYAEFLAPASLPIDGGHIDAPLWLAAICAYASPAIAPRCFARLEEVLPRLAGGVVTATAPFITGARLFAAGDLAGAARAWRPLVASASGHIEILGEAMVQAFAAIGEDEVVERIGRATASQEFELHGASLVTARVALAARARGDHARAETLTAQVLAAWSAADTEVPVLARLRRAR